MEPRLVSVPPFVIPVDVIVGLKAVFAGCNDRMTGKLSDTLHTYETSLDMAFIEHVSSLATPVVTASGWTINLQSHYLGGGHHFPMWPEERRWEIADIGPLVLYGQAGKVGRAKAVLLQSKRLYADEIDWDEDNPVDYLTGFGRLFTDETDWDAVSSPRRFTFTKQSHYKALRKGDAQYDAIVDHQARGGVPVFYMLYNPAPLPYVRDVPAPRGADEKLANVSMSTRLGPTLAA